MAQLRFSFTRFLRLVLQLIVFLPFLFLLLFNSILFYLIAQGPRIFGTVIEITLSLLVIGLAVALVQRYEAFRTLPRYFTPLGLTLIAAFYAGQLASRSTTTYPFVPWNMYTAAPLPELKYYEYWVHFESGLSTPLISGWSVLTARNFYDKLDSFIDGRESSGETTNDLGASLNPNPDSSRELTKDIALFDKTVKALAQIQQKQNSDDRITSVTAVRREILLGKNSLPSQISAEEIRTTLVGGTDG